MHFVKLARQHGKRQENSKREKREIGVNTLGREATSKTYKVLAVTPGAKRTNEPTVIAKQNDQIHIKRNKNG